ncbi:MAG: hypothetical protein KAJ07_00590 [Planctomycetes bacterium]|nr:hypothetical protein [Planctomycetota bacterium]
MTLGPKYIRMFDTPEIQEGWEPKVGDRVRCGDFPHDAQFIVRKGAHSSGNYWIIGRAGLAMAEFHTSQLTYEPSIEQLAEMWLKGRASDTPISWGKYFICRLSKFPTLQKDWPLHIIVLAFIMHDLYSKTWDSEKGWIRV